MFDEARQKIDDGRLDASSVLNEDMIKLNSVEAFFQNKLDTTIGCSLHAEKAMSAHQPRRDSDTSVATW